MRSQQLQPAWVLHRRPYGDNGALVELLTLESGRLTVVCRGFNRRARGGSHAGVLQHFTPLLLSTAGRGELRSLGRVEVAGNAVVLRGTALFSGFYLNEILVRLLPRFDPHPQLFAAYGRAVEALMQPDHGLVLRRFEVRLLEELGYQLDLDADVHGVAIREDVVYGFDPEQGLVPGSESGDGGAWLPGRQVALLREVLSDESQAVPPLAEDATRLLRRLTRDALAIHLGPKPLRSRELLRQFQSGARPRSIPAEETSRG